MVYVKIVENGDSQYQAKQIIKLTDFIQTTTELLEKDLVMPIAVFYAKTEEE
jgi:hypothetical protein